MDRMGDAFRNMIFRVILLSVFAAMGSLHSEAVRLSDSQALRIGKRIWQNECAGTVEGLTSWNKGEDFASLGIGHFIWYPKGKRGPFEESFPGLAAYLKANGVSVPSWMEGDCPWKTRSEFEADLSSERMKALRTLLAQTVGLQAKYAALRLEKALPKMLEAAPASQREEIRRNFYRVAAEPMGLYALMDYVNFKGEGVSPTERYKGEGWGLLQVLGQMKPGPALASFSSAAAAVLRTRVKNSPPERNEARWLPGWMNRVKTYDS